MLASSFIERNSVVLYNINSNATQAKDVWVSGTGYGFYSIPYEYKLSLNRYYYLRCQYKFTTTNQSPTWCTYYFQGGGGQGGPSISNPVAGTEYTISGVLQPYITNTSAPITSGTIYNGESSALSGVTSYVKNVLIYDVTDLFMILRAKSNITSINALATWCNTNLDYVKNGVGYDISSLITDTTANKVCIKGGNLLATELVETDGMQYYSVSTDLRNNTWFDSASGVSIYNNSGNGTVTHTRVAANGSGIASPFYPEHKYVLKIVTNGVASPGAGGFIATHIAAANKIFIEKFVAKVPSGYTVVPAYNSQGTGASVTNLTDMSGTGSWKEYAVLYKCGSSGSFSSGGHIYLNGPNNQSVTWYLAYANSCEITSNEDLKYYSVLRAKETFKNGKLYTTRLDETNILPNGDCSDKTSTMLPSGWSYDSSDTAGNASSSLVQPVGAGSGRFGVNLPINPTARYKVSYWVKCKADMTSFLTAIAFKTTSGGGEITHSSVVWVNGTKTTLASALNTGATSMTVASASNWTVKNYSRIGFRSGSIWSTKTYNDLGTSNAPSGSTGMIKSISGNTITFNTAYTGANRAAGTVVVESYDGGTYPYPVGKDQLPTDNTWKYVEGYFGANDLVWEGNGTGWVGIPTDIRYIDLILNLYNNTGTVPIKYADIRVEEVGTNSGHRQEQKILIKKETN